MNIDERLEALTHSVELLAQMHRNNEERYEKRFQANQQAIADLTRIVAPIAQLVIAHEERLKRLEDPGSEPPSHN